MKNTITLFTLALLLLPFSIQARDLLISIFFLIIFEASLVAFDPLIDQLSQGEVAIKVIFNSGLAFAIFTTHHFLEGRMNSMIRKN